MITFRKGVLCVVLCLLLLLIAAGAALAQTPQRVLIVVMDQMRPGYAQQFDMTNVLWLQNNGVNYDKAYVGDMASETVVSHNVMVSGLLPKHMGWSDEVMRDTGNVLNKGAGAMITTGDLGYADYVKLIDNLGYPKLGDYLHAAFPDKKVYCVGEKAYQVESMAASSADYYVRIGSAYATPTPDFSVLPWVGTYRSWKGVVPDWLKTVLNGSRYMMSAGNASDAYGTDQQWPSWLYPEDGRMVPGVAGHEGGDAWVADITTAIMAHNDWSGIFVNFGAIDKIGHMWGGGSTDTYWDPNSVTNQVHMKFIAKNADDQLGKLLDALQTSGQLEDTLVVVTADHASTYAEHFNGVNKKNGGNLGWYYDPNKVATFTTYGQPNANNEAVLGPLNATHNVAYSYQSTAIETWLIDQSRTQKLACADVMRGLPGVIATYVRDGDHYDPVWRSATMTPAERSWLMEHGQELVDTMAFPGAADVVGLLADHTSYGVYGDHGGAQMDVQRIPMAFYTPGIKHLVRGTKFRTVDIMPTVLRTMDIAPTAPMDGDAYNLPIK
jgi:hypothetical protein